MTNIPRSDNYAKLWKIVDGAVADAFNKHPDYLTDKGRRNARASVTKRVVGTVLGFAEQSAGSRPRAADMPAGRANLADTRRKIISASWRAAILPVARLFGLNGKGAA